jgi:hypothetical protein
LRQCFRTSFRLQKVVLLIRCLWDANAVSTC